MNQHSKKTFKNNGQQLQHSPFDFEKSVCERECDLIEKCNSASVALTHPLSKEEKCTLTEKTVPGKHILLISLRKQEPAELYQAISLSVCSPSKSDKKTSQRKKQNKKASLLVSRRTAEQLRNNCRIS